MTGLALAARVRDLRFRGPRGALDLAPVWNYLKLLGGSMVRLCLSLAYFVALTRSLSLADFGFFASVVAVGTVLARLGGFGYGANLFQMSATRSRLLGVYLATFGVWFLASLPACLLVAGAIYQLSFAHAGGIGPYLAVVATEVVVWRLIETVGLINTGLGRFGHAAMAYNIGTAGRALAALIFLPMPWHDVSHWAAVYALANLTALAVVVGALMPRIRPRWRRRALLLRWRGALALGGADLSTSVQAEIDKVLVLTLGGALTAGLYAICIRVIDLTAVPIRAFNLVMIQRVLKNPALLAGRGARVATELAVALVSTAALGALLAALRLDPGLLGRDVAQAAGTLWLLPAVPAFRNLLEYQAELLYAYRRMGSVLSVAVAVAVLKTLATVAVFALLGRAAGWAPAMNLVFGAAYALSAIMTYRTLRHAPPRPRKRDPA